MEAYYIAAAEAAEGAQSPGEQKPERETPPAQLIPLPIGHAADKYTYVHMPVYDAVKRVFDVVFSLVGLILASPIMLAAAIAIKAEDHGPAIYVSKRVGYHGKTIRFYKFRSMKMNADRLEDMLTPEQMVEYKKNYKLENDPRVTRVGRLLRKTSIDELPQLMNVLNGSLSIIGPRPIIEEETEMYGDLKNLFLSVRPGLTGYWQAYARSNVTYEDFKRQDMELYYVSNRSFWLDIKIFFRTILIVLRMDGAK